MTEQAMVVKAWSNSPRNPGAFYGLQVSEEDRARYFRPAWKTVAVKLPGNYGTAIIRLSRFFWGTCPELRSERIGRWLRGTGAAPWEPRKPPRFRLHPTGNARFEIVTA